MCFFASCNTKDLQNNIYGGKAMKLKRIMALIMCAVLVTMGGVYATWNYAIGQVQAYNAYIAKPVMANVVLDASMGTLKVDTRELSLRIDDDNNDKQAELVIAGNIKIIFTPHADADPDIIANGLNFKYTLEGADNINNTFNDQTVFAFNTVTAETGTTLEYTIGAEKIKEALAINNISLPTYEDYQLFQAWLPNNLLKITVEAADAASNENP